MASFANIALRTQIRGFYQNRALISSKYIIPVTLERGFLIIPYCKGLASLGNQVTFAHSYHASGSAELR